jgi:hypothetical protein
MNKKGIKKYQIGIESLAGSGFKSAFSGGGSGMVNPANAGLKQMTTTSPSTIPTGSLPTTGNISQVANTQKAAVKGPSFGDKAGAFMGNYGGAISSLGTNIAMLINANKKQDPTGRPYKKGSKLIKYQEGTDNAVAGPTRKEAADLMRKYNEANKNNPNIIGAIDEEEFNAREQQLQDLGVSTPIRKSTPPSLIPSRQVSFKLPQQSLPTPKLNKVAIDKPSRRERKAENKRLETLARAPITYTEPAFVGPINQEPKKGTPFLDDIVKKSMSSEAFKKTMTPNRAGLVSFKQMTPAQQKQYRAGIASGNKFTVEGIGEYAGANKSQISQSARMAAKGNKPDTYYKDVYESRKPTLGKNFGTTKTPFVGAKGTVVTSKKEEIKPRNNKQVNTNTQESSTNKTTVSEFNSKAIMAKKKELADLRSNVPGFGPFRSSSNSKLVGDIDNINRQLYKISQKQSAFERNKTRGLGDAQALKEAKARELEFKNLTKNLKFK